MKERCFVMIRQFGFPSLLILHLAAETKWPELLRPLGELVYKRDIVVKTKKLWTANKM